MVLALGVDGGGTQTRCVVLDEQGHVAGFGISGPSKPDAVEPSIGSHNLQEAIQIACQSCGGAGAIDSIFLGLGGVNSPADVQVVIGMLHGLGLRPHLPIGVDLDVRIALAGATAGQPGITLIVGTGSSCYGRNAADEGWRSGGWGYIIDDYGSGFYLGQKALEAIIRAADGRNAPTALTAPCLEALGISDLNALTHRIYYPRLDHTGIAALAPIVVQVAEEDAIAHEIIERGCDELALMVAATTHQLGLPDDVLVVPVGSLGTINEYYRQALEDAIHRVLPQARIRPAIAPAVFGAAFLALQQLGITLSQEILARLNEAI
ncbi:MAG: BadF/BadG/BcrA/BcrD ATPase family protein [Chloroflexota bacterium]